MKKPFEIIKDRNDSLILSDMIPLSDILDDNKTIATKEGSVLQIIALQGKDYTGMAGEDCRAFFQERKLCFETIPPEAKISIHYHRKKYALKNNKSDFGNKYANEIADIQNHKFSTAFKTEIYVVVSLPDKRLAKNLGIVSKNFKSEITYFDKAIADVTNITGSLMAKLASYKPRVLAHTNDGHSPLLHFWLYLLNGGQQADFAPVNHDNLNETMAITDLEFRSKEPKELFANLHEASKRHNLNKEVVEEFKSVVRKEFSTFGKDYVVYHNSHHRQFAAFLSIKAYPEETDFNILENLMSTQIRFNVIHHIAVRNKERAKEEIKTRMERWKTLSSFGSWVHRDLADFATGLEAGAYEQCSHIFSICVFGETPEEVERGVYLLQQALAKSYVSTVRENAHTEAVFWAQFPDYEEFNKPRQVLVSSTTIADFINFGSKNQGNTRCSFGDAPVSFFKTPDGQNYAFTFHPEPDDAVAGHTLVIGGSGKGKSVLMSYLAMCCLKYHGSREGNPLKSIIFDSLKGMKIPVSAFGGDYINFEVEDIKLNPMQLPDNPENRRFLERWIEALVEGTDDNEKQLINAAIRSNYETLELPERSLDAIRDAFGIENNNAKTGRATLATRLKKWLPSKEDNTKSPFPYGMFFNHKEDAMNFKNRTVGFDMTNVLKNDMLLAPLTSYIFHAFSNHVSENPCPHLCVMDEAIKFMESPFMRPFISMALLEWRKRNGVFIAAVQDIGLMMGKPQIEELLKHFQTYIIFQNPTAGEEDYIGSKQKSGIGLTKEEFQWVKANTGGRQIMVKRKDGSSVILDVDLSNLQQHLVLLRSEQELVRRAEKFMKEYPDQWQEKLMESV